MISVAIVGLGYFSRLHQDAWAAHPGARIVGVTDLDPKVTRETAQRLNVPGYSGLAQVLDETDPDLIDIVAPPPAHAALIRQALKPGRTIICQKPFCTSLSEARQIIAMAEESETTIVIHENFRFQPWYRTIKMFLDAGQMGTVFQCRFNLRPGDGRGPDAYLARQPAFQTMPRLLIHETGVHFIDLFRWLFGDIASVYADLRRLNPAIAGEDAGILMLSHVGGAQSVFDGNRLSDIPARNPRLTMGAMTLEGEAGTLHLDGDGRLTFRPFGDPAPRTLRLAEPMDPDAFGGGCVAALITHVLDCLDTGRLPENTARDYLPVMLANDAAYWSDAEGRRVDLW